MATRTLTRTIALVAVLVCASHARAQGDLDILLRTVPPVVMIQVDTSGSMANIILPPQYVVDRGVSPAPLLPPANWFNTPVDGSTPADGIPRLAAQVVSGPSPQDWNSNGTGALGGGSENYQRTCQIFSGTGTSTGSICAPGAAPGSAPLCADDDANGPPNGGAAPGYRLRCWNMPGAVAGSCPALVPAAFKPPLAAASTCTTTTRNRLRGSACGTGCASTPSLYTTIILPDYTFSTQTTYYPVNHLWWMLNEIYNNRSPEFIAQDRLAAAKQAVTQLINQMNVDGQDPKVKFGLAQYNSSEQGGHVVVPATLTNKNALLAALNNTAANTPLPGPIGLTASGRTPLSETLVDVARYLAGASLFGTYPQYNRSTTGVTVTASSAPQSPVDSQCEKIFIVVVTDGLPRADFNDQYPGVFTATMGPSVAFPAGFIDGDPPVPGDGSPDSLDDVAARLFADDLRPTVAGTQNAITYTVGFSLDSPLLEDAATRGDGEYYSSNNATELGFALSAAVTDILLRNTTLTAANVPASRSAFGDGFYTAYFTPGGRRSLWPGHLQAFTVNASLVVVDDANQSAIDPLTDLFNEPRNPHWDLGETLIADYASRSIYTTKAGARADFKASDPNDPNAPFITATDLGVSLSEEPQYPQDPNQPDFTTAQGLTDAIVNFIHGFDAFDEDDDGSYTDVRPFVLGDIFHSNPIAIGPPLPYLRFETGYGPASDVNSFMGTYGRRDRVMYVGANDGMLHGVAAGSFYDPNTSVQGDESYTTGDGSELFGYVPGGVLSRAKLLPKEDTGKQYFVDGPASAADVWIDYDLDSTKEGSEWTTALLTPLREGGESMLALDVTDPAATSGNHGPYPRYMWEFTHTGLGQTWSKPIITRVKLRAGIGVGDRCGANNGDGDCIEQWVAIFGAGYRQQGDPNLNLYTNDPNNPSYTRKGRGVYVVNIKTGAVIAQLAQDPNSATYAKMRYAIPAEPAVLDLNFDGFADVVYIGDLGGQLWKWDLSAIGVQDMAGVVSNTNWPAGVVFEAPVATTAAGVLHYHSIFQSAAAAFNNRVLTLSFASGERANLGYRGQADPNDPNSLIGLYDDNNRFWVLKDRNPTGTGAFPITLPIYEEPLFPATAPLPGHGRLTDVTTLTSDPNTADEGYFFRVADGEKFMTNHLIFGGNVATVSYTPSSLLSLPPGTCALGGTTSEWAWELDDATAALDDPINVNQFVRTRTIGNGAATDPRITVSKDPNGRIIVRITAQTSMGEVTNPDGGGLTLDPVDMIYWRQNF